MTEQRKRTKALHHDPCLPASITDIQIMAVLAMGSRTATPEQQNVFVRWLIDDVCRFNDRSFQPDSPMQTAFAEGKRFVAGQVIAALNRNPVLYKDKR